MLTVGFLLPSSDYLFDPFRGDPHSHFQLLTVLEWHFGARVQVSLIDLRGIKREFAQYHIPACDVYLHSVYTLDYAEQLETVETLRRRFPEAKHIAGGPHAVTFREESLKVFDALVLGDGERCLVEALEDLERGSLKKVYEQRALIDINEYPFPRRHFLPASAVARPGLVSLKNTPGYEKLRSTTVIFSRGCPYDCRFCAIPEVREYAPGVRYRKPEFVEEEIEYLKKEYGVEGISLLDEISIPLPRAQAVAHLEAIGRTGIVWRAQCRVDGITPEIAKLAREAGCVTMAMGVESVSQRSLDLISKRINVAKTRESIRLLKEAGIECRIYMILGLPGEPEDIVQQTWDFIEETDPESVYLSVFTLRPGTEVYTNPERFGIKRVSSDWSKTMHMYGRYDAETPDLTFEYQETTPWGRGFTAREIVGNYLELQDRIKASGRGPVK
ncbi:hypothetical protein GMLC_20970 [Geomonas limicola]|uniref:Radical SAM core domain-containing protein n=1 Tax=Geomonas limicola TaxID=2740186 RepID=A0A6V8N7I9_9BACT|nr:radical SAM protein [Geomonas limicola]GFO68518.1 hypothetical protein GMLC_20970 [Geomonas limicola]